MDLDISLEKLLEELAAELRARGWMLATAESCTGGMIAASCTRLAGSSEWFERGFVTHNNTAKTELLDVPAEVIVQHGAVSEPVARAMAEGALRHSRAQVSVSVTGIAGPGGGSADKPVGTVWMGWCMGGVTLAECRHFGGSRHGMRYGATAHALLKLLEHVRG